MEAVVTLKVTPAELTLLKNALDTAAGYCEDSLIGGILVDPLPIPLRNKARSEAAAYRKLLTAL